MNFSFCAHLFTLVELRLISYFEYRKNHFFRAWLEEEFLLSVFSCISSEFSEKPGGFLSIDFF